MLELAQWLLQHIPSEDSSRASGGIVHGDFRIDNVVFHPNEACCCKCFYIYIYIYISELVEYLIKVSDCTITWY
jgi:hypothetical protein